MLKLSTSEAREIFAELVNRAAFGNERVVLTRHGKELVALVSVDELQKLLALDESKTTSTRSKSKGERKQAAAQGRAAMRTLQQVAKEKGLDKMSDDEIDALVQAARKARDGR